MLIIGHGNIDTSDLLSQQNQNKDRKIYKFITEIDVDQKYINDVVKVREDIDIKGYIRALQWAFTKDAEPFYGSTFFGIDKDKNADYNVPAYEFSETDVKTSGQVGSAKKLFSVTNAVLKLKTFQNVITPSLASSGDRVNLTLVDDNVRRYLIKYNVEPYILNTLRFEEIYTLVTQTPYFPKTRNLIVNTEVARIEAAYEDIPLPLHPFWNGPILNDDLDTVDYRNKTRGASFTEPDFYLANPSVDYEYQESIEGDYGLEVSNDDLKRNIKGTPQDLYNLYVDLAAEYARGDVEGIMRKSDLMNSDRFSSKKLDVNKPANTEGINRAQKNSFPQLGSIESSTNKQMLPITSEYYKVNLTPKNFITPDKTNLPNHSVNIGGVDADNNPLTTGPEWGGNRMNISDLAFAFGDNLDLMDPLVSSFDYNSQTLKTSRLLNWSYQEYDFENHEIRKGRLRNQYSTSPTDLPEIEGGVSPTNTTSSGDINFFVSDYYINRYLNGNSSELIDPILLSNQFPVDYTNAFGQVREEPSDYEFTGDEILAQLGDDLALTPGQGTTIKKDGKYRFHKGIDIFPAAPRKSEGKSVPFSIIKGSELKKEYYVPTNESGPGGETVYKLNFPPGVTKPTDDMVDFKYDEFGINNTGNAPSEYSLFPEYNDLIPLFAPFNLKFNGSELGHDAKWNTSGFETISVLKEYIFPYLEREMKSTDSNTSPEVIKKIQNPDYIFWKDAEGKIVGVDQTKEINGKTFAQRIQNNPLFYLPGKQSPSVGGGVASSREFDRQVDLFYRNSAQIKASFANSLTSVPIHIFTDPYAGKNWIVFKNGIGWGDDTAGCRASWEIIGGALQGSTLISYHQSYMLSVDAVGEALKLSFDLDEAVEAEQYNQIRARLDAMAKDRNTLGVARFLIEHKDKILKKLPDAKEKSILFGDGDASNVVKTNVEAGEFIGFIGRTGFSASMLEHAHIEVAYKAEGGSHVFQEGSIAWRIDLGPLLEKGTKAPDKVISAYYKTESFSSRYKVLYAGGFLTGKKVEVKFNSNQ